MPQLLTTLGIKQTELDEALTLIPTMPTRLLNDPMWQVKPLRSTTATIESSQNEFDVISERSRTDPPNAKAWGQESKIYAFSTLHFNLETRISASDIQDVRKIGTPNAALSNSQIIMDVLKDHRSRHDLTHEWFYLGAIKGKLVNKHGDEIVDLYKTFGMTEPTTNLKLTTPTTDVIAMIEPMIRKMQGGLNGDISNGVTALCSEEFFDALVNHKSVRDAWMKYEDNVLARENTRGKFAFKGINFEIYNYKINGKPMIEAGHAHAYLTGMRRCFTRYNAPCNQLNAVNTVAQPFCVSLEEEAHKRGVRVYTESNMLPICLRPQTLMHITAS